MIKPGYIFIVCLLVLLQPIHIFGQPAHKGQRIFYLVRHAEKDTGSNPAISAIGKMRAGDLYRKLKSKKIDLIMATTLRRTVMTADSLRIYQHIGSIQYQPDTSGDDFIHTLNQRAGSDKHILVVGHSNTLPALIRKLGVASYTLKELPETEFDNLFIIKQKKGKARLKIEKYGKPS